MKKQLHYLSLLILLSLCGCEVTLHDNYVETEPLPLETPIEIKLDAEQNSSGELLLIEGLKVGFQINTPESRLISASFYIGNNPTGRKSRLSISEELAPLKITVITHPLPWVI